MSVTKKPKPKSVPVPDVGEIAKRNPHVNVDQVEETHALLVELRKGGLRQRGYGITSPYVRRPLRKGRRSGFGTPYG
jgi:hypothetical protein